MGLILLVVRLLLAILFAVAGVAKLLDPAGSRKSLLDFGVPSWLARPVALLLPLAELGCAVAMIPDSTAPWAALGLAALLVLFIAGISVNLARGRKPDCHCFGQLSSEPVSAQTVVRNVALLGLAGLVAGKGPAYPGWYSLRAFSPWETATLAMDALLTIGLVFTLWFLLQMLRQNGRLLVRLEAVEAKLSMGPSLEPEKSPAGLPVGAPAPDFVLTGLNGETLSLGTLRKSGKPVLLMFTEPGCGACETLHPELGKWQTEYADRLTIVPISSGDLEVNRSHGLRYGVQGVLLQTEHHVSELYRAGGTPNAVLISDGVIASPVAEGAGAIRDLVRRSTLPPPLKRGEVLPPLRLPDLDGATMDLAALRGSRTLLLFWSPSCGFCQQMLEDVKKWERSRSPRTLELLIISSGSPEENRKQGLRSTILLDQTFGVGSALGAEGTPSAVIIDEHGRVASEVRVGASNVLGLAAG